MPIVFARPVLPPVWESGGCQFVSSYDISAIESRPTGIDFKDDGTKAYVIGVDTDRVHQFSLSTPYDFVTGSVTYDGIGESLDVSDESINPAGGAFSNNGQFYHMIEATNGTLLHQYDLTVDWDISSGVYHNHFYDLNNPTNGATSIIGVTGVTFKPDGSRMYITNGGNGVDGIYQFDLNPSWDITSAVYNSVFVPAQPGGLDAGIKFSPTGYQMFVTTGTRRRLFRYDLTQPWNIATATVVPPECNVSSADSFATTGLAFNPDGSVVYLTGFGLGVVSKFSM